MAMLNSLESALAGLYKGAPKLSQNAKKFLVRYWPIAALVFGILQLWAALALWNWGRDINKVADAFNAYLGTSTVVHHLSIMYWLSLVVLIVDGVILLAAYKGLKARAKSGWNLLFYSALLNAVYGILSAFNDYGGASSLIIQVIVSAVVLYFLFAIRDQYSGAKSTAPVA